MDLGTQGSRGGGFRASAGSHLGLRFKYPSTMGRGSILPPPPPHTHHCLIKSLVFPSWYRVTARLAAAKEKDGDSSTARPKNCSASSHLHGPQGRVVCSASSQPLPCTWPSPYLVPPPAPASYLARPADALPKLFHADGSLGATANTERKSWIASSHRPSASYATPLQQRQQQQQQQACEPHPYSSSSRHMPQLQQQ